MTFDEAKDALYAWTSEILPGGFTVALSHQPDQDAAMDSAPTPPEPYCVIHAMVRGEAIGEDQWEMDGETMKFDGVRKMTVQFRIVAGGAGSYLANFRQGVNRPSQSEILRAAGLSFVRELNAIDGSSMNRAGWERRATIDQEFRFSEKYEDEPGVIEDYGFEGNLASGHDGYDIVITEDFTLGD